MTSYGETLKQARERRGVSLDEIARETKINVRYLEALERNEIELLPGGAFGRGYVKTYAEFVGVEARPLIEAFEQERGGGEEEMQEAADAAAQKLAAHYGSAGPGGPSRSRLLPVVVVLLLLIAAGVWGVAHWLGGDSSPSAPGDDIAAASTAVTREAPPPSPAAPEGEAPAPRAEPTPVTTPPARSTPAPREPDPVAAAPAVEVREETPAPSIETPTAPVTPDTTITIPEFGVGDGVVDRMLQGRRDRFTVGEAVWFWTRVVGAESGDRIRHVWLHEGKPVQSVELKIGAAHWRTQSKKTIWQAGEWVVEARDAADRVLARSSFICEPKG